MPSPSSKPRRRRGSTLTDRLRRRDAWVRQIAPESLFHVLFDHLPGLHFFAKNRRGETMFSSESIRRLYGLTEEPDVIGLTDFDLNPAAMAQGYVDDDERIYRTGAPVLHHVELWWDARGIPDWYQVTKLPIRSRRGRIIGIMGVLQRHSESVRLALPWRGIDAAVQHIRENFRGPVHIADLARRAGLSPRQLERRFRDILGVSPQEFLITTRVLSAGHALRHTNASLADIAADCGFCDQSSFTSHFRRLVGRTPGEFRRSSLRPQA